MNSVTLYNSSELYNTDKYKQTNLEFVLWGCGVLLEIVNWFSLLSND